MEKVEVYYEKESNNKNNDDHVNDDGCSISGGKTVARNSNITVKAKMAKGSLFGGWFENGKKVSSKATYTFKATKSRVLLATFNGDYSSKSTKGYKFKGWYIGKKKISNKAKYSYKVTKKVTLTANFKKK